jgi:hypothetical protein
MAADSSTGVDGTQEPSPSPVLSDPLSGLVTGYTLRLDEFTVPRGLVPKPPDSTQIREALEAVLEQSPRSVLRPPPSIAPAGTPDILQPARQWPAPARVARRLRATEGEPPKMPRPQPPLPAPVPKPSGMRTGTSVVMVIVLVTAVILFYVVSSFANTVGKLFG